MVPVPWIAPPYLDFSLLSSLLPSFAVSFPSSIEKVGIYVSITPEPIYVILRTSYLCQRWPIFKYLHGYLLDTRLLISFCLALSLV